MIQTDGDRETFRPDCSGCQGCPNDGPASQDGSETPWSDGPPVVVSIVFFLGPLATAIFGAAWLNHSGASQLAGAVAGLAVGMIASLAAGRFLMRVGKEDG